MLPVVDAVGKHDLVFHYRKNPPNGRRVLYLLICERLIRVPARIPTLPIKGSGPRSGCDCRVLHGGDGGDGTRSDTRGAGNQLETCPALRRVTIHQLARRTTVELNLVWVIQSSPAVLFCDA